MHLNGTYELLVLASTDSAQLCRRCWCGALWYVHAQRLQISCSPVEVFISIHHLEGSVTSREMSLIHFGLILVLTVLVWRNGYLTKTLNNIISVPINVSYSLLLCIILIDRHLVGLLMLEKPGQITE